MKILLSLLISGIFTNNVITFGLLGVSELENSKNQNFLSVLKNSTVISAEFILATLITYPVLKWILMPLKLEFLSALVCTALICAVIFAAYVVLNKFLPVFANAVFKDRKTLICSVAALGLCLMNLNTEPITDYPTAILYSLIAGIGFTAVSLVFFAINNRINDSDLPECVKGLPITLVIVSLLSLAFGGFAGI